MRRNSINNDTIPPGGKTNLKNVAQEEQKENQNEEKNQKMIITNNSERSKTENFAMGKIDGSFSSFDEDDDKYKTEMMNFENDANENLEYTYKLEMGGKNHYYHHHHHDDQDNNGIDNLYYNSDNDDDENYDDDDDEEANLIIYRKSSEDFNWTPRRIRHTKSKQTNVPVYSSNNNNNNNDNNKDHGRQTNIFYYWYSHTLLPDTPLNICNTQLLELEAVKLFKFVICTIILLIIIHRLAIFMHADRDETYTFQEMVLYDANHIILDVIVYFVVGRFYHTTGVDSLEFILPCLFSSVMFLVFATYVPAVRHSFTAYDIHCLWTWQMWTVIFGIALPLTVFMVGSHFVFAIRQGLLFKKLFEMSIGIGIFVAPYLHHPLFHLHHWYYAFVLGMHANFHTKWWSKLTCALLFGVYLHGIAVWGRDPILGCAISWYQSHNQQCPFVKSLEHDEGLKTMLADALAEQNNDDGDDNDDDIMSIGLNWHTCEDSSGFVP